MTKMKKQSSDMIRLGLLVIIGSILFIAGVYYVGNSKNMFGSNITVYADFSNVRGLQIGNNVRFMGINVGSVSEINLKNDTTLRVSMRISKSVQKNLKKDALASIGTNGLVGASLININPGEKNLEYIEEGDILNTSQGKASSEMIATLDDTNETIAKLSVNLLEISDKINSGDGLIGSLLNDQELAKSSRYAINSLATTSKSLEEMSSEMQLMIQDVKEGKGVLGYMINDTSLVVEIEELINEMDSLVDHQVKPGFSELAESIENINSMSKELNVIAKDISEGKGAIGVLLKDENTEQQVRNIIANLDSSSVKLDENLQALRRNWFFKKYFKEQEKKQE